MPIALNPARKVRLHLDLDREIEESKRPVFVARYLTADETSQLVELYGKAIDAQSDAEARELLNRALAIGIVGWENIERDGVPVPFGAFSSILSPSEMYELVRKLRHETALSEIDLKKSRSPSPEDTGKSAPAAATASVLTPPAQANP